MRVHRAALLAVLLAAGPVGAREEPRFRYWKELARGSATGDELLAVTLDSDVYATTRERFPDLRILNEKGTEVSYALEQAEERRTRQVREACASEVVSLREVDGKDLEIVVRLAETAPNARGLTALTPLTNYEHRVRVYGSKDGKGWSPLVSSGLIFDYTRYMDVRNRDIPLPDNTYRWFKLVIEQVIDERESPFRELTRGQGGGREVRRSESSLIERRPLRIDSIELWRFVDVEGVRQSVKTNYPVDAFHVEEDAEAKVTRVQVRSQREPLTGLILETKSLNFSRSATVRVPVRRGVKTEWVEISRGTISRIRIQTFRREELRLDFPERRDVQYQVVIENGDNPPPEITGMKAEGNVYRLVFLASDGRPHRVAYGSDAVEPPRYDTAAVLASLRPGYRPTEVRLGAQAEDRRYRAVSSRRGVLNQPIVLILAIVLMVAALAWVLFRAGRHIKGLADDEL